MGALVRREIVVVAEELLQVHAGAERIARAGEDQHLAALVGFERVDHLQHLGRDGRVDAVALLGPVQRDPGDPVLERDQHGLAARNGRFLDRSGVRLP